MVVCRLCLVQLVIINMIVLSTRKLSVGVYIEYKILGVVRVYSYKVVASCAQLSGVMYLADYCPHCPVPPPPLCG